MKAEFSALSVLRAALYLFPAKQNPKGSTSNFLVHSGFSVIDFIYQTPIPLLATL